MARQPADGNEPPQRAMALDSVAGAEFGSPAAPIGVRVVVDRRGLGNGGADERVATPPESERNARSPAGLGLAGGTGRGRARRRFETPRDGVLTLDAATGALRHVDPSLEHLLCLPRLAWFGKELWEIAALRRIAGSRSTFETWRDVEWTCYETLRVGGPGGERRHLEVLSTLHLVDGVRVIQWRIRDTASLQLPEVTQLRHSNERLSASVEALQRRGRELTGLSRLSELLQTCETTEEAYRTIAELAPQLLDGCPGALAMLAPSGEHLECVSTWGEGVGIEGSFPPFACWAIRHGGPHAVVGPDRGLICGHFDRPPCGGYFCLPLSMHGTAFGLLHVAVDPRDGGSRSFDLAVEVGRTIELALANLCRHAHLLERATRDALTGLFNRRYLDETLPREIHSCLRRNAPLSVVMIDIDHFKQFNDRLGHEAGDRVLRDVGRLLATNLRQGDIACRYGGEEFVLVLSDSLLVDTVVRLEQLRHRFEQLDHDDRRERTLTFSAGVATAPQHASTAEGLLRAADEALYAAKRVGRNCVMAYQPTA